MKKFLGLLLGVAPFISQAQNGFFAEAGGSIGFANINYANMPEVFLNPIWPNPISVKPITGFSGGVTAGYRYHNWGIATGVSYLQTGYTEHYEYGEVWAIYSTLKVTYDHVSIPLKVDYRFNIGKKLSLSPGLEFIYTDNLSVKTSNDRNLNYPVTFSSLYNAASGWGGVFIHANYKVGRRLSIFAGPEAACMFNDFTKNTNFYPKTDQKNNYYMLNAGVGWSFSGK